ncbi:AMP-binding protein, partial [bacterium]|nr:AMP-binding protein [bacterium]
MLRAVALLNERANRVHRRERVPLWLDVRCRLYDALVASRFRRIAGGRVRLIVSGGASLDRSVGKILRVLGLGVVEGYGLTEASPVVCCGRIEDHRLDTVGRPLTGVDVVIADDGEVLVRGPNVMKGYLNKPDETT